MLLAIGASGDVAGGSGNLMLKVEKGRGIKLRGNSAGPRDGRVSTTAKQALTTRLAHPHSFHALILRGE